MLTGSSCFLCGILLIGHAHAIGERVMIIRQVNTLCGFQLIEYLDSRNKKNVACTYIAAAHHTGSSVLRRGGNHAV